MSLANINAILKKISDNHENDIKLNINSKILTVDLLNLFIRAYSANPSTNDDGVHIGGTIGSLLSLGYAIKRYRPTRVIIVSDGKNSIKKRKEIFDGYKAQRPLQKKQKHYNKKFHYTSAEMQEKIMKMELKRLIEYLDCLPVIFISQQNLEADDVI
jgi:5'-3' exonuclease